jgi:hypothetical protein
MVRTLKEMVAISIVDKEDAPFNIDHVRRDHTENNGAQRNSQGGNEPLPVWA